MKSLPLRSLILVAFALAAAPGLAQELDNGYQVEVIIFAQRDHHGAEGGPIDPRLGYPPRARFLDEGEQLFQTPPADADRDQILAALMVPSRFLRWETARQPASFVPLPAAERQLNPDAAALARSQDYRVLFHAAWRQPALSSKAAPWVVVTGGQQAGQHRELEGSLRIFQSRFLHLETDLWLSSFATPEAGSEQQQPRPAISLPQLPEPPASAALLSLRALTPAPESIPPGEAAANPALATPPGFQVAAVDVLKTSDPIETDSLRYIDHPRLGALVLVTAVKKDEDEQ